MKFVSQTPALLLCLALALACSDETTATDANPIEKDGWVTDKPKPKLDKQKLDKPKLDKPKPKLDKSKPVPDKAAPKLDKPKPVPDKAAPKPDKAPPKPDKAPPTPDKALPPPDKALPPPDKAAPKPDKALPTPDKAPPPPDKALPTPDKAPPPPDKALPTPDKALPTPDKALPTPDKALPPPDKALPPPDKAPPTPDQTTPDLAPPTPDQTTPDLAPPPPDQTTPDQAPPPPDQTTTPDLTPPKPDWPQPDKTSPPTDGPPPVPYTGSFPQNKTGFITAKLTVGGTSRTVQLYLPKGLGTKPPLMLTFHGTNGDAKGFITSCYARTLADQQKVIIASPQALKPGVADWDHQYNNEIYWQTHPLIDPATNPDLMLVQAVIQEAQKAYNTDPRRTVTLGHSSGGFFATLAAMTLPHLVAGFAESSAGLVRCANVWSCTFTGKGGANTCAALSKQSGYSACMCTSGTEKPGPVTTTWPRPAAYLFHHTADGQVSSAFTCALASRLALLGYTFKITLDAYPYHAMPYNFALNAWAYLSSYPLP